MDTFDILPKGALPNRRNVVVSRTVAELPGCDCYPSIEAALQSCSPEEDIYILGGESIYRQTLPLADRLCLTEIADIPEGADAFFPDYSRWHETWREHSFVDYEKKN